MARSRFSLNQLRLPSLVFALFIGAVSLATLLFWAAREIPAELTGPQANDRQVTLIVTQLLRSGHLSKRPLDDEISHRALDTYLKMIDPLKLYLRKSDVAEFMQQRDRLDEMAQNGDISFAYQVFHRYLQRMDERVNDVERLLEMSHDYSVDEELTTDPDVRDFAATDDEAHELWRKRIKYDMLVAKTSDEDEEQAREKLARRYRSFSKRRHQTDNEELLEMYLTAITSAYDPHTNYMSRDSLENFHINMKLNLEGIGAALSVVDGYTVVTRVIPGGAADKAGVIKEEDQIVSVGEGEDGEMEDVVDMKLSDVVKKIRGRAGTVVRLGVIPSGGTETKIYDITRATIKLSDSEARGVVFDDETGAGPNGSPLKVGVIDLPSFYMDMSGARQNERDFKSTTRDVARILEDFKRQDVDAVILDLRRNGGGSLTEAISLTGLFIDEGPVVQVKGSDGQVQHYDDLESGMKWDGPLVVLTSKFSASASEILAGAIQDYRRGLIIGDEATHGKGTVQSLLDLGSQLFRVPDPPKLGALKITMQQFYRPNGDSTQKRGVLADIALPSLTSQMDVGEADLDYSLDFDRVDPVKYARNKWVDLDLLTELRARSTARRSESKDFDELMRDIRRYKEQKERTAITLNELEYRKQREELDAEKEEEKQLLDHIGGDRPVVQRDFYINEVIAITADYLQLLAKDSDPVAQVTGQVDRRPGG